MKVFGYLGVILIGKKIISRFNKLSFTVSCAWQALRVSTQVCSFKGKANYAFLKNKKKIIVIIFTCFLFLKIAWLTYDLSWPNERIFIPISSPLLNYNMFTTCRIGFKLVSKYKTISHFIHGRTCHNYPHWTFRFIQINF